VVALGLLLLLLVLVSKLGHVHLSHTRKDGLPCCLKPAAAAAAAAAAQ
jgi:hypothetical protein